MYEVNEKLYAVCHNGVFPCVVRKICDDGIAFINELSIILKYRIASTRFFIKERRYINYADSNRTHRN